MACRKGALLPLREDLKTLSAFLRRRDPCRKTEGWRSRMAAGGFSIETYAQIGRLMVRHTADLTCDCRQLPHTKNCSRLEALYFEDLFFTKWGLTRYTEVGEIPFKIQELGNETPLSDPTVLPFRRSAG